jgi:hypothetical protein
MTDLKMLEAAARAAGFKKTGCSEDGRFIVSTNSNRNPEFANWQVWNPRDDDGDTLRLAVALRLTICIGDAAVRCRWLSHSGSEEFGPMEHYFDGRQTVNEATRLAVLRAAAAIGGYREAAPG